jgi:signal transduction histidine kinase/CheY-like chemotaxis protein
MKKLLVRHELMPMIVFGLFFFLGGLLSFRDDILIRAYPMTLSAIATLTGCYFLATNRFHSLSNILIFASCNICAFITSYTTGGFTSVSAIWLIIGPLIILVTLGKQMGRYNMVSAFLLGMYIVYRQTMVGDLVNLTPPEKQGLYNFMHLVIGLLFIWSISYFYLENNKKLEIADEISKSKDQLLATISHELRTPLNGIYGALQVLDSQGDRNKIKEIQDIALNSAESLKLIIGDILDYSKMHANKFALHPVEFSLQSMVDQLKNEYDILAKQKYLTFNINYQAHTTARTYLGDENRLLQILRNILNNAFKFTFQGGIKLLIEEKTNTLNIKISDTGIGIKRSELAKIFNAFVQVDMSETREYGGTGLGLAICKELVDLFGGKIAVDSLLGKGTSFSIQLPTCENTTSDLNFAPLSYTLVKSNTKTAASTQTLDLSNFSFLIAEDDKVSQVIMAKVFETMSANIKICNNGLEALEAFKKDNYDLVLLDNHMPHLSGVEACKAIRQLDDSIPIIALTGDVIVESVKNYLECGFSHVLSKPFNLEELKHAISRFLP